ncbi:hypothetical protein M1L60_14715 [Actinoplanes sp. TRM 88003]|uniref:Lipoprotein n=1 Tax=Paractinoplanes aksuensis TaxID=2939490 RepID=A0ABT1DLY0_9ACTN|nr:hypothetical protein [Actinoplanes aksuensis]MCO8271848.1 hypothetical protein [Actinoplanes aksuensis]
MRRHLMVGAIALVALAGCGGETAPPKQGAKVATLESAAASAPAKAKAKPQRPRERLDTTPEEYEAMLGPYNKCMKEQGGFVKGDAGSGSGLRPATKAEMDKTEAANRICEPQFLPLPPWEKDPANPEARDFAREVVACLKGKGIKYVEVSDDGISIALGGEQNDSRSISRGLELAPECERQVAAGAK